MMTYAFSMNVLTSTLFVLMCTTIHAVQHIEIEPFGIRAHRWSGGVRSPVNDVVINEDKPVNEQYPSAVLFGRTCGGTIISPTWILTAAHCTLHSAGRYVHAGTNNTRNGSGVQHRVKRLVIHPSFTVGPYWLNAEQFGIKQIGARWDFLLAELEKPLLINNKTIAVAQLDNRITIPVGEEVAYAGFGTDHHGGTMSKHMHARKLQVLADADCSSMIEYDSQDMVCTIGRQPNLDAACNGDSGSGLMSGNLVIGVTSWAEDDATSCRPGVKVVFARVAAVRDWIKKVTNI